jgi:hypothetical protein
MAVVIDSGPVRAQDRPRRVPQEKWRDLMLARRYFLQVNLKYDCRCLVEFVKDAEQMFGALGYANADAMIREGYQLDPSEIKLAVEWLKIRAPDEPVGIDEAKLQAAAAHAQQVEAKDLANPSRQGQRTDLVRNENKVPYKVRGRPHEGTAEADQRRLRKDRPDIHERVLAGELSPNAGMMEAGFRKRRQRKPKSVLPRILKLLPKLTADERAELRAMLAKNAQTREVSNGLFAT